VAAGRTPTANLCRAVALATAIILTVTACGGASSHYVTNKEAETYFKVPKDWQAVQIRSDLFVTDDFLRSGAWAVFFAPDGIAPDALLNDPALATAPIGLALIGQLEQGSYDSFGELNLRAITYTDAEGNAAYIDPLELGNTQDDDIVRIAGIEAMTRDGLRGYRMRYQLLATATEPSIVYDQVKLVHDETHTFYWFRVVCKVECFNQYNDDIGKIFDSLRIRRDQP
jgi:hypothetical protein